MIIALFFLGLLLLLFTGLPIFAGLALFGGALQLATQGELGSVTEIIFGDLACAPAIAIWWSTRSFTALVTRPAFWPAC
jgi:hypothetical protein